MYTVRFNPVFHQWVLVGPRPVQPLELITEAHLMQIGGNARFVAAHHPRQPFVLDPIEAKQDSGHPDMVYASEAPVGEYELMLYRGTEAMATWNHELWFGWLDLIQHRVRQMHENPHLHHLHVMVQTAEALPQKEQAYIQAGSLVATSQQLTGMSTLITQEVAEKMYARERLLELHHDNQFHVILPSAPLHQREVWIIPQHHHPSIEQIAPAEKQGLSVLFESLIGHLNREFSDASWTIRIHTGLSTGKADYTWWIQLYQADGHEAGSAAVHPLPEQFLQELQHLLGYGA